MAFDAAQHRLPVGTVLLERMRLMVKRDLTVLVRLAVLRKRDFFRLDLALFILGENEGHATEDQR